MNEDDDCPAIEVDAENVTFSMSEMERLNLSPTEYLEDWIVSKLLYDPDDEEVLLSSTLLAYKALDQYEDCIYMFVRSLDEIQKKELAKRIRYYGAIQMILKRMNDMLNDDYETKSQERLRLDEKKRGKEQSRRSYGLA